MLTFWAVLSAENVESYVRGLMLPNYLSHLVMDPLSFHYQKHNADGRLPLVLTYRGPGRFEEFLLEPVPHALGLLSKLDIKLDTDRIVLSENDAIWNWTLHENSESEEVNTETLRIFFEPKKVPGGSQNETEKVDPIERKTGFVVFPQKYDTEKAYVSASRREIFIGFDVLTDFTTACCRSLLAADSPLKHQKAEVQFSSGTFQFGPIRGRFTDNALLDECLVQFAGLHKPLQEVAGYFENVSSVMLGHQTIDETGIRIQMMIHTD